MTHFFFQEILLGAFLLSTLVSSPDLQHQNLQVLDKLTSEKKKMFCLQWGRRLTMLEPELLA